MIYRLIGNALLELIRIRKLILDRNLDFTKNGEIKELYDIACALEIKISDGSQDEVRSAKTELEIIYRMMKAIVDWRREKMKSSRMLYYDFVQKEIMDKMQIDIKTLDELFEVRFDGVMDRTGNLFILTSAPDYKDASKNKPSGIYIRSDAEYYVQGNYQYIFMFTIKYLKDYELLNHPQNFSGGFGGFGYLLPGNSAREDCLFYLDVENGEVVAGHGEWPRWRRVELWRIFMSF